MGTKKKWGILALTYNVANKPPDKAVVKHLLDASIKDDSLSLIAISLQEIRPSERMGAYVKENWREYFHTDLWSRGFVCICSSYMVTNLLMVFGQKSICPQVEKCTFNYSRDLYQGAKGTIAATVKFRHETAFLFCGSHFVHSPEQLDARVEQAKSVRRIFATENLKNCGLDGVVWMGDLNFRVVGLETEAFMDKLCDARGRNGCFSEHFLKNHDQLTQVYQSELTAFVSEADVEFLPTYRFKVGRADYDPARIPSWTDRILTNNFHSLSYKSIETCYYSDHRPVYAQLRHDKFIPPSAQWDVRFEPIDFRISGTDITVDFNGAEFWKRSGSYRDWLGVYRLPEVNDNCFYSFVHIFACVENGDHYTAAFNPLPAGRYIIAYHSYNCGCIKGMSEEFEVRELENENAS